MFPDKTRGGVCIYVPRAGFQIFQVICLQLHSEAKDASSLVRAMRKKRQELSTAGVGIWSLLAVLRTRKHFQVSEASDPGRLLPLPEFFSAGLIILGYQRSPHLRCFSQENQG